MSRRHKIDIQRMQRAAASDKFTLSETLQGHVGPNTKQIFESLTATPFSQEKLKLAGYEFIIRDQFSNYYFKQRAMLFDGEMYDVDQWIKPSMMMRTGGNRKVAMDDWVGRHGLKITEELIRELREVGAVALARMNVEIMRGRHTSTNPIALETKDVTHQANLLEDKLTSAIEQAKEAAGEPVAKEPIEAPEFKPLTAVKAPKDTKLETVAPGTVIAFPELGTLADLTPPPPAPKTEP